MVVGELALLGLFFAVTLSVLDFVTEGIFIKRARIKEIVVSLAGGVSSAYIFLALFPLLYSGVQVLSSFLFIFVLLGFATYHIIEKIIYQHAPREKIVKDIAMEHLITLFLYHFVIGIELVSLTQVNLLAGLFFFVPVGLHMVIDALPHKHMQSFWEKVFFTSGSTLGGLVAILFTIPEAINFALLGLIAGLLLFLEIREVIPKTRKGKPFYFLLGMTVYGSLIVLTWLL